MTHNAAVSSPIVAVLAIRDKLVFASPGHNIDFVSCSRRLKLRCRQGLCQLDAGLASVRQGLVVIKHPGPHSSPRSLTSAELERRLLSTAAHTGGASITEVTPQVSPNTVDLMGVTKTTPFESALSDVYADDFPRGIEHWSAAGVGNPP